MYTSLSTEYHQEERFVGQEDLKTTGPQKGLWICLYSDISLSSLLVLSRKNKLRWTDRQLMGDIILFQKLTYIKGLDSILRPELISGGMNCCFSM